MKILLVNQCFYPDVVSTAQHLTDLAIELSNRGHEVTVIASNRGYDDPDMRFVKHEVWKRITVRRISGTGFGKRARWRRVIDFGTFIVSCAVRMLLTRRVEVAVAMTSPPLISFFVAIVARLKGWSFAVWTMDLNPDEAIAAGWLRQGSMTASALSAMLLHGLRRAEKIIVLDRFVRDRILSKGVAEEKLVVIPPWSHDDKIHLDNCGREQFRSRHGLAGKYVVMYSGNHSPCHPLDTLLEAAKRLLSRDEIIFCFVGGGSELSKVKSFAGQHELTNVITLPYQSIDQLAGSLSAADLHVVVMGDPFVGIVHPCKIYNILSIGTPVLYIGPSQSHITDILSNTTADHAKYIARHGDVDTVVLGISDAASRRVRSANRITPSPWSFEFSKQATMPRMLATLESICETATTCDSAVFDSGLPPHS
jgi:colanic acid biosynthesis glycosyl transferase WcaI